jgi:hypothetical protein
VDGDSKVRGKKVDGDNKDSKDLESDNKDLDRGNKDLEWDNKDLDRDNKDLDRDNRVGGVNKVSKASKASKEDGVNKASKVNKEDGVSKANSRDGTTKVNKDLLLSFLFQVEDIRYLLPTIVPLVLTPVVTLINEDS